MKKKYRIKKAAKNPFSALSGIEAIQLSGAIDCLVAHQSTCSPSTASNLIKGVAHSTSKAGIPLKKLAYCLYHKVSLTDIKRVTQKCGVDQCVKKSHLEAEMKNPTGWVVG